MCLMCLMQYSVNITCFTLLLLIMPDVQSHSETWLCVVYMDMKAGKSGCSNPVFDVNTRFLSNC